MMNENNGKAGAPWWRHGYVWLILSGPAIVVVAGFVTFWIAARGADPLVAPDRYRQGTAAAADKAHLPALQGRNHAQTPSRP